MRRQMDRYKDASTTDTAAHVQFFWWLGPEVTAAYMLRAALSARWLSCFFDTANLLLLLLLQQQMADYRAALLAVLALLCECCSATAKHNRHGVNLSTAAHL